MGVTGALLGPWLGNTGVRGEAESYEDGLSGSGSGSGGTHGLAICFPGWVGRVGWGGGKDRQVCAYEHSQ